MHEKKIQGAQEKMNDSHIFDLKSTLFKSLIFLLFIIDHAAAVSTNLGNKLEHVHVIFAHKLYAPLEPGTKYGFPKTLDYEYFLQNTDDMPNEAKLEMFHLGVYLRRRYDKFLGDLYYAEVSKMRTSEHYLSMISGLLVNAGLWPPAESQKWNDDLDWQPIPTEYEPTEHDRLFLGTLCPHFLDEEKRLLATDESIKTEVSVHEPLFHYVSTHYGGKIERPSNISMLYSCLESIASYPELNKTLPGWAEGIFPDGEMRNVTLLSYELMSKSSSQKQLNGGVFLKRIIGETSRIIATNTTQDANMNVSRDFKISMYSGEERNVIGVLQAMDLWWSPHMLENGASIILELRQNRTNGEYGFEIYYYTGLSLNETIGLTLPGCNVFCPLSEFARIVADVLPTDEKLLCDWKSPIEDHKKPSSSDSNRLPIYTRHHLVLSLALLVSCIVY